MRILFLTQVLPFPLDAGPKIRANYVLRYLASAGHEVSLVSLVRSSDEPGHVDALRRYCSSVETIPFARSRASDLRAGFRSLLDSTPFLVLRDQTARIGEELQRIASRSSFDACHADQLWMAPYGMSVPVTGPRVLDQHNAVFMIPRRMAEHCRNPITRALLENEATKLKTFERKICRSFDRVAWVTDEDRRALVDSGDTPAGRDVVIPIATDPDAQLPVERRDPFRITFLGGTHWPPNRDGVAWFINDVWPRIAKSLPSPVFTVIGKPPSRMARKLPIGPRIEILGYVSQLERLLSETLVFVVPLRSGAGMRVKILDAWSWGLPVVSTTVGAEGLKAVSGENLLIADDAETFADAVIRVVADRKLSERLARSGRATVEKHYDWKTAYEAWDDVYRTREVPVLQ